MNKEQKQMLKEELNKLEKEYKTASTLQIILIIAMVVFLLFAWPLSVLIFIFLIIYAIVGSKRKERINDLKFKLAGEK